MSEILVEWIALILFVLLLVGSVIGETLWLVRKGWATSGLATGFVLVTDLVSLGIGSFIVLVSFFVMFMMVMGPAGTGGTSPDSAYVAVTLVAVIFPPAILFFSKRLGLMVFKIRSGKSAWIYSLVSSLLMMIVVLVPPPLLYYVIASIVEWKR